MKKLLFGAFLTVVVSAPPAWAQDEKPVQVNVGGSVVMPLSGIKDDFGTGGSFNIGVIIVPPSAPHIALQAEYGYNHLAGQDKTIPTSITPGGAVTGTARIERHHNMQYNDIKGILGGGGTVSPYAIGGFGMYYRSVSLTTPDVGFTTWCDPYWYVCYPTAVAIDRVIGERSSWDPGIDLGGGISFKMGDSARFYVESRWHYMWGPSFTDTAGVEHKANGQYLPITFGFRV
jgi:alpha-D-ribose 1-methylphosphonate 5-triphosphate synthase subunit PhnG